jgi:hypothetical protein
MKQFLTSLTFTLLFYVLASILASDFNPTHWQHTEGKLWFMFLVILAWVTPMFFNYLDGKPNFED